MTRLPTNQQVDDLLNKLETVHHIEETIDLLFRNFGITEPVALEHVSRYRLDKAVDIMLAREFGV